MGEGISVGGFYFGGDDDVLSWIENHLPPTYPFGAFVDIYGLLARFVAQKSDGLARSMDAIANVFLTASKEITLETFRHALPVLFGKCAEGTSILAKSGDKMSMLPGMRKESDWLSRDNSGGVKACLEEQMDNVTERLQRSIEEQLGGGDARALSLAHTLLAQSILFLHELTNYITLTLAELKCSGFSADEVWYLMSKLVFWMFAIDFHKVRSIIGEGLDVDKTNETHSRKMLARRALWGILQTHAKMREYLRVGFKNHPSVSSEYVRFLIQNASAGKVSKLELEIKGLKERLTAVEVLAKNAMKKGETALNRADKAKKLAKK